MRSFILGLCALLFSVHAHAQDTNNATGTGTAQAANSVTVVADAGRYAPADTSVKYSGHTYTTPVVGGSYFAGANPCLVGTGIGAAGGPIGFNINVGKSDAGCTRRSDAAAWHALGYDNIAISRMCQDVLNADAFFASTGFACPGADRKRYKLADGSLAPVFVAPTAAAIVQAGQPVNTPRQPGQ